MMHKILAVLASLVLITLTFLAVAPLAKAAAVSWDRPAVGRINPINLLDTVYGNRFIATSTLSASVFPYASTTGFSVGADFIRDLTGSGLSVISNALAVSGLTTSNFSSANISQWTNNSNYITLASLSATPPVTYDPLTGIVACPTCSTSSGAAYPFQLTGNATSTLTQFNGGLTAYGTSTIGAGAQTTGLTVSGGATTTGNAYFAGVVGIKTQPSAIGDVLSVQNALDASTNVLNIQNQSGNIRAYFNTISGQAKLTLFNGSTNRVVLDGAGVASQFNDGLTAYASSTIGGGTAASGLTVNGTASSTKAVFGSQTGGANGSAVTLALLDDGGTRTALQSISFNSISSTVGALDVMARARGTATVPLSVLPDDIAGSILGQGYDGAAYDNLARIRFFAGATTSPAVLSGYMDFRTTNVAGTEVTAVTINNQQNVGIGTTSPYRQLSVANSVVVGADVLASYYVATSSTASVLPNASTTALSINNKTATGDRYLSSAVASSTWTATSTENSLAALYAGTLVNAVCYTDGGTSAVQFLVAGVPVLPAITASTTKGTITFASANTFLKNATIGINMSNVSSATSTHCTADTTITGI